MINIDEILIGFIGQGWIGKHYADDFEERGYSVVRYALEEPFVQNKEKIKKCDIVFIAVPTPTTPGKGFDDSILRKAIKTVGKGKTAVIKSTILPGTTERLQEENPDIFVIHSPEFLREVSAAYDARNPVRNIVGVPVVNEKYKELAEVVISILPIAPYKLVCHAKEAELVKYIGNVFLHKKVIFSNLVYDLAEKLGINYESLREAVGADPRIGKSHMKVSHQGGRGSGGHCFLKDYAAFIEMYENHVGDELGLSLLRNYEKKNIETLRKSGKDLQDLKEVYGDDLENVL